MPEKQHLNTRKKTFFLDTWYYIIYYVIPRASEKSFFYHTQKMTEYHIPKNWTPVAGASRYALTDDDYIYNLKTDKKLKRYWQDLKHHSFVTDDEGVYRKVNHNNPSVVCYGLPDGEFVVVADYPDYKVTPYGAVWKYQNTGKRHRGNPFLVNTKDIGKKEYARLKTRDGRAHWVRMEKIMEEAYPND